MLVFAAQCRVCCGKVSVCYVHQHKQSVKNSVIFEGRQWIVLHFTYLSSEFWELNQRYPTV